MDLLREWKRKFEQGRVLHDPNLLVIRPNASVPGHLDWGTLFYSKAREDYKSRVRDAPVSTSFDLELMQTLEIGTIGGLIIAANPNSLFEGHLVIYPAVRSSVLTYENIRDLIGVAAVQPEHTFIHNMENSAASIVDWAHFQSYPMVFPIEYSESARIAETSGLRCCRISSDFPAYSLLFDISNFDEAAGTVFELTKILADCSLPGRGAIPFNLIFRSNRMWIIPRAAGQSALAARYFGGLEMGGVFCLPNADEFRRYLGENLRQEIVSATLRSEPETAAWFEQKVLDIIKTKY